MAPPTNTQFAVAVHVLTYLAAVRSAAGEPVRLVSSDELAVSTNVNPVHIRRVLGPLRSAGIVESRPGVHGGWLLTRDPAGVSLADVWRQLVADDPLLGLHEPSPQCPVGHAINEELHALGRDLAQTVEKQLDATTIAGLLTRIGVVDLVGGPGTAGARR